jgi:hypothetical protein
MGLFVGLFLPGLVGGDAVRFLYLNAAVPQHRVRIASSLIVDRLIGLMGLIIVIALLADLEWQSVRHLPGLLSVAVSIIGGGIAAIAAATLGMGVVGYLHRAGWFDRMQRGSPPMRSLFNLIEAMLLVRRAPLSIVAALALSTLIHGLAVTAVIVVAGQIHFTALLGPLQYAFAASLTLLTNALPLSPGGLGIGEAAFDQLCRMLAPGNHGGFGSVFFAFRSLSILAALIAAPSFVLYRRGNRIRGESNRASEAAVSG